jgi:hypothetical protein
MALAETSGAFWWAYDRPNMTIRLARRDFVPCTKNKGEDRRKEPSCNSRTSFQRPRKKIYMKLKNMDKPVNRRHCSQADRLQVLKFLTGAFAARARKRA